MADSGNDYPRNVRYGDFVETCRIHGGVRGRFGTLIDPNGHKWLVCDVCINALWGERQQMILSDKEQAERDSIIDEAMEKLRISLFGPSDG